MRDPALPEADRGRRLARAHQGRAARVARCGTSARTAATTPRTTSARSSRYAAERHITVVPEIDIPGHSQAAIAAYPELGNTDVVDTAALGVLTTWGVNPNVLAPTEATLRFYENVLDEVLGLFPRPPFVHIGGDECPKEQWKRVARRPGADRANSALEDEDELQSWIIRHFDGWLAARGRRLIGWDEILEGGLARRRRRLLLARLRGRNRRRQGRT